MNSFPLPPVSIPASDHQKLEGVLHQAVADHHPVAGFLRGELRRAVVVSAQELPADTVALNGWVTYRHDWGWLPESRVLVCPQDYCWAGIHLSVLSPLGAALLGLRVGDRIRYSSIEGITHVASVESLDAPVRTFVRTRRRCPSSEP